MNTKNATPQTTEELRYLHAPKTVDELTFVCRRGKSGGIYWWDVTTPETDYWLAHHMQGRAYALVLLDLIENPLKSKNSTNIHSAISPRKLLALARRRTPERTLGFLIPSASS